SIIEAVLYQHPSVVSYLFFMRVGEPVLYVKTALKVRSSAIFQVFLDYGWNINEPLERTMPPALSYISDDRGLTEWFLNHGADPNTICAWDFTPMSEAMCRASLGTIKLLFDHGGNIEQGQLLHHAVQRAAPDVLELVGLLLDRGASINEIQYENHAESWRDRCLFGLGTPLHYAAQSGNIQLVMFLLSKGADATIKDTKGRTAPESAEYYRQSEV
ncbi:ankyrin repeat-containing domain protein, partial [Amylocarpus encephaloides]